MQYDNKKALSAARFDHAKECFAAAKSLLATENYKSAANRCYYAIFHGMRSVLAFDEIDMKHHSGIISEFRKRYIKTEIFETRLSEIISMLFAIRTDSDYDDFFVISKEEVIEQIENAEYFLGKIDKYLKEQ
ncbi:MAG: HEPN domain-containing protein [Clostridia bacterium]|nr:HEPN domain-containing protein [Clostridia bacterium]